MKRVLSRTKINGTSTDRRIGEQSVCVCSERGSNNNHTEKKNYHLSKTFPYNHFSLFFFFFADSFLHLFVGVLFHVKCINRTNNHMAAVTNIVFGSNILHKFLSNFLLLAFCCCFFFFSFTVASPFLFFLIFVFV